MEKPSPSYIQTNHGSEDRDGENYRYFSIKFVKEIEYADSSSSQEDLLDHECRKKIRRDWSLKDGSDLKDQQSKKDEEKLEVKQLAVIPDTGVANLIEAWKQQTSHFQTMVEKNDELLEMNLRLMQEMSTIKTNNVHLQEELADVRQYVENMKRDLKQMVPTSTDLSKKYQDLVVSTSDHATCSTENTSPWFTVQDAKDDDNLQKEHFFSSIKARRLVGSKISLDETCPPSSPSGTTVITVCETPKTTAYGTCTETDKERSCTAISAQRTGKESYLNSGSSHSLLMRKFSNDQRSARTSSISSVNVNNEILNAHAENNLPSGKNTPVNGGQTTQDYSLTINQLSNDHKDCIENFPNAFWPIGNQDKASAAEIKDVLIRSSASSKSSLLLKSSVSHDSGLSKKESCNQMKGNRSVTFMDSVSNMSKMESVPEERSLSGTIQNITAASENAGVMSSSKEICVKDSIEETGSLSKPEDKFPFHKVLISSDGTQQQSQMGASGLLNERNDYFPKVLSASSQTITACSVPSSKETLSWQSSRDDTTQEICSLSKSDDKVPQTRSRTSGSLNERNDCLPKDLNFDEKSSFVSVKALIQKIYSDINKERVGSLAKAEENVIQHDSSTVETGLALPQSKKHIPVVQYSNTMNLAPSCLPTVGPYVAVLPSNSQKRQTTSNELGIPNCSLQMLNTGLDTTSREAKMPKTVPEKHDFTEISFRKPDASLRKTSLTPKADKTEYLAYATCVQNTSFKNGNIVVENVGPMIVVRDWDKEQLTMIASNISVPGRQQNMHSKDKPASLPSQDDNLSCQKTADRDQNRETDNDKILIENVGPIITKPHPSTYTRAQVSKEESSSSIFSPAAKKTLFIDKKSGLVELPETWAVRAVQNPAAKEGEICKKILDKTASTKKIDPTAFEEQKPSYRVEDTALIPEYLCIFFEDAIYHPEADVKVPGTLRVTRDGYDGLMEFKCSDASLNFWQSLSDMQLLPTSSPYYTMWSTYQNIGPAQKTFRLSFQSIESATRLQSIVSWMLRHMELDSQNSGSQPSSKASSSHRRDPSTDHMDSSRIPLHHLSMAGVKPAGLLSTIPAASTDTQARKFTSALGVSSQFSSLKCTAVEALGSVGKEVKHPTGFPFAEPDASDYQNTSLKEKTPVSSSHEKVPLGHFSSPTTAARPSVWNSGSSCGPLPSPPLYRFMFPCTVSILQEKVKELCFKEKRAKSALGQDTKSSKKDSSRRQSAGVLPQDACQTSSPDRPITACQDREANSSSILDIPQRDNSLDPRNAWKRLAKTCLSSGRSSRIADLSTQLLYASKIRNLQFATVNRPATAPYQCTDLKQHSNNLSRTELSSHSLGTSGAKDLASFSSPYICIFACHVRLVRLDPRGIRCDTKMLHPNVEFVEVQILHLNEPGVYKVVMLSGTRVCASHFISKSMMLQSLSRSSLSAQKSKSSSCRETQKDGSMQGSVTRGLNPSSTASQQQRKLDVKDRYKSGNRFAAVVNALRTSATTTTTTTEEVTPGCSELTLSSLGPGWIYMALDMASKPLHMQCFVLVFPTQRLAIQFKAVFNRCREEVQQASDRILVALSTFGQRKSQQNANWSCVHTDAGASAAELVTSSEVLEDCRSGSVSWGESEKSETMKRADPGAQQRCCCTRVASSGALFGRSSCGRKPSSVGKNNYNTAGVMASDEDCIADSRSEVMASQRSACHSIILPASALISRSDPCCMCARKAGLYRTRDACRVRGCTKPFNPSFDARRHSIGGAVGTEDIVLCEESGLDIATYRRETWRKDAERCHSSSEHHVGLLGNCSCNCMNANDGDEATAFTDLDNEKSTYAFTTADTGDSVELHEAIRYSSYEENAHQIRRSTSAESTAAHAGTATRSELMELCLMESSRRGAGSQSRHRKEEEKGRHASCTEVSWKSSAPIRAIRAGPETTVKADWLAMSRAKEGRQEGGRQRHGTATDAFFGSGRLDTTARTDFDFLSPELQMDNRLWSSLGYLGKERKDGVSLTSDLNCQGHVDGATDMTEVFVEYSCCYCEDEDSLSIASDDNFLSLEDDDEENGAEEKNAANDPDDPGEAGRNTLPIDPQTTSSHQSTSKGSSTVNMPAAESDRKNTETLENKCGLHEEVSRGGQKEERDQKHSPGDDKMIAQQQVVSVAGRALDCRSTTCSQMSLRGGPAEEKRRARSPALRHGGHPDFRHRQGLFPSTSPRTASGTMVRGEAHAQNGDEADVQVEWAWPTGGEPHVRRPSLRQDDRGGECLPHLAEREHHQAGSQGDSRGFRECLVPLPSGSGNRRSSPASSRTPDSTFGEDEAVIVSRRDAYSIHPPRSGKCRVPGASESRRCWRDSPGRSTMRKSDVRPADTSPPTASAVSGAGGWQTRRGAWLCTTHPGWTDLNGEGAGLSTSCCVRIVREGDRAARLIVTQLKDDVVLCNRVIDAGLIITQPAKKPPGKVVRLVMSAWHKGKRMKVALLLRFRSSKLADQFIVALREAQRISRLSEDC